MGVNVYGEEGVLVADNLCRAAVVRKTVGDGVRVGRCPKPGLGFNPRLLIKKTKKPPRINRLAPRIVGPIEKKDLIWGNITPQFPS